MPVILNKREIGTQVLGTSNLSQKHSIPRSWKLLQMCRMSTRLDVRSMEQKMYNRLHNLNTIAK